MVKMPPLLSSSYVEWMSTEYSQKWSFTCIEQCTYAIEIEHSILTLSTCLPNTEM